MSRTITLSALAGAAALLCGCATPLDKPADGYTCCNLTPVYGNWISSNNVQGGPRVPLGTPASFSSIKRTYYVYGQIGGKDYGLRNDSTHDEAGTLAFLNRIVVKEDPATTLATWPAEVQAAVRGARVRIGMTRPQVAMAIGYPSAADTPDLGAATWAYWVYVDDQRIELSFDAAGRLAEVKGQPNAVGVVLERG